MQTIRRILFFVIIVPAALLLVAFAVANRASVAVSLNPLGDRLLTVEQPLYLIVFAALILGLLIGGVAAWCGQAKWRRAARLHQAEAARLRQELARARPAALPGPAGRREAA